ncbi:lipoamide acyltransferase component of branched-chain alpha-keto acid dehydrogenase complex [Novosphingobium endophyticum]|uniref:Dihydrolipoamide acetyltransferase component of pyruvate dehydrogenase complex n=1 Tax=Novosphingobium endophyticum TaxID=1955250 RepID=A0A916TTL2_9SPHN|nr:dihydrolipoamide acetyltransferase family protein [Novosphingobium endophyticum]GGC06828.1 lipoamide acyltransferase component of branched-chain alpha-keto acid dehydrogenase complex [Novosphingobium endophyticum]
MLQELKIPRMGSVENARLVAWHIDEGQSYGEGDILYEIETDKTTTEVEATSPGILAQRKGEPGDDFKVGDCIGLWAAPGTGPAALRKAVAALDGQEPRPASAENAAAPVKVAAADGEAVRPLSRTAACGVRISPLARRLAAQHGVDVAGIAGSGAYGKITGKDVLKVSNAAGTAPRTIAPPAGRVLPDSRPADQAAASAEGARVVPHSLRRKTIARRMVEAAAVPSLTADMEIDLTALFAHRASVAGKGTSVLGLIAHAAVSALVEHRSLNAHWNDEALIQWDHVHLGIAVDTAGGLIVPVIRHAERLNARGLTEEIARVAQAARDGSLSSADLEGGTFTISNPGSVGPVIRAEALLNVPQVALLGLPGIVRAVKVVPDGDGWATAVRRVIRPSLTFDHRALDGGPVIAFLNTLKIQMESL